MGDYFELAAFDGLDQSLNQVELGDVEEVDGQRWMETREWVAPAVKTMPSRRAMGWVPREVSSL